MLCWVFVDTFCWWVLSETRCRCAGTGTLFVGCHAERLACNIFV